MARLKRFAPLLILVVAIIAVFASGATRYLNLEALQANEAALRAFYAATPTRFARPGRMALSQVFFSTERPSGDAQAAAAKALSQAKAGAGIVAGDPSIRPSTYGEVTALDLGRDFGPAFERLPINHPARIRRKQRRHTRRIARVPGFDQFLNNGN